MTDCKQPEAKKQRFLESPDCTVSNSTSASTAEMNADIMKVADEAIQESNRRHVKPIVEESSLGIELFVGDTKNQFHGLIKQRYADFIVHEIDLDGNVALLTSLEAPEDEEEPPSTLKLDDFLDRKSQVYLSNVNSGQLEFYKIDVTGMDKEMRTSLHQAIRESYDRLESSTCSEVINKTTVQDTNGSSDKAQQVGLNQQPVDNAKGSDKSTNVEGNITSESNTEERKYIIVTRRGKTSRPRFTWPRNRPDHLHFVLYKENKDTMEAIQNLAAATNSKPSSYNYAGTKDRRAVTTQWISSWRLEPKRLIAAARRYNKRPFIKVGNFCFKKDPIRLGQLQANKFDIIIRHLVHNTEGLRVVEEAMTEIRDKGFINYFGLQRFGTRSIQTHEVGLAILQGIWEKATNLILSYRYDDSTQPLPNTQDVEDQNRNIEDGCNNSSGNNRDIPQKHQQLLRQNTKLKRWASGAEQHNSCIDLWKSRLDADLVFKRYPHFRMTNEGLIIKSLSKSSVESGPDYAKALASLPRNVRSMYVHSYQSLIWNKLTTYRLKKHGFSVIPGDLILSPDAQVPDNKLDALLAVDETDVQQDNETLVTTSEPPEDLAINSDSTKAPIDDFDSNIILATKENAHKYTIFDVVLPLIGSRVKLPTNDVGDELERLLKLDDLGLNSFKKCETIFVSYGSYRKILVKPKHLNWTIKQYSHPHENLVETDLDRLNRELSYKDKIDDVAEVPNSPVKSDSTDEALIVGFELPPSSYATMCLREMMKKPSTEFNNRF